MRAKLFLAAVFAFGVSACSSNDTPPPQPLSYEVQPSVEEFDQIMQGLQDELASGTATQESIKQFVTPSFLNNQATQLGSQRDLYFDELVGQATFVPHNESVDVRREIISTSPIGAEVRATHTFEKFESFDDPIRTVTCTETEKWKRMNGGWRLDRSDMTNCLQVLS